MSQYLQKPRSLVRHQRWKQHLQTLSRTLKQTQLDYSLCRILKLIQRFPEKWDFFVALFVGLSKQKYFAEKEQGFSKFITMVCKESCQLQESRGSQDSVTPHGLPSDGCPASPTLAVSRPINFVEVAGPSSLLNSNTTFGLPAEQHET